MNNIGANTFHGNRSLVDITATASAICTFTPGNRAQIGTIAASIAGLQLSERSFSNVQQIRTLVDYIQILDPQALVIDKFEKFYAQHSSQETLPPDCLELLRIKGAFIAFPSELEDILVSEQFVIEALSNRTAFRDFLTLLSSIAFPRAYCPEALPTQSARPGCP